MSDVSVIIAVGEELREYEIYVAKMAARADGTVILNHSLEHATIILAQIFKTSANAVKLLSGQLDVRAYGSERICDAAVDFLARNANARIEVLTETSVSDANPFVAAIRRADMANRLSLRVMSKKFASISCHFAVGDDRHFRFEADKDKCEAFVKFGDPKLAGQLSNNFDRLFSLSAASHIAAA